MAEGVRLCGMRCGRRREGTQEVDLAVELITRVRQASVHVGESPHRSRAVTGSDPRETATVTFEADGSNTVSLCLSVVVSLRGATERPSADQPGPLSAASPSPSSPPPSVQVDRPSETSNPLTNKHVESDQILPLRLEGRARRPRAKGGS